MATEGDLPAKPLEVLLRLNSLSFDQTTILKDISLDLPAGKFTCLLGPSGVGKSSILRILSNSLEGIAEYKIETSDDLPLKGRVAYMAQKDLLLPWSDCLQNVIIGEKLRGKIANLAKAKELLNDVGLSDAISKKPDELSGGMRQRVALARTLMEDAPLVLLDEPFSALDAISRHDLQNLTAKKLSGRTVLMITHDPLEALRMGHQVLVLAGRNPKLFKIDGLSETTPREVSDADLQQAYAEILSIIGMEKT
ncbi:ATP-binding cassette domain-containing protein [Sneathiella sp. P13V-1]|nr:ATP-binding cassette domain-containing protein [Sneathiella sp. P13V-1]